MTLHAKSASPYPGTLHHPSWLMACNEPSSATLQCSNPSHSSPLHISFSSSFCPICPSSNLGGGGRGRSSGGKEADRDEYLLIYLTPEATGSVGLMFGPALVEGSIIGHVGSVHFFFKGGKLFPTHILGSPFLPLTSPPGRQIWCGMPFFSALPPLPSKPQSALCRLVMNKYPHLAAVCARLLDCPPAV